MTYIRTESNQRIKDYTGFKKAYLQAISFEFVKNNSTYWKFKCDCGNYKILKSNKVLSKNSTTKSCGCKKHENKKSDCPAFNKLHYSYVKGAKRRGLDFLLTIDEFKFLTSKNCYYCGIKPSKTSKTKFNLYTYNGIDRKDNLIGYTLENSLPCCTLCNKAKRDLEFNIFIKWIEQIKKFNNKTI